MATSSEFTEKEKEEIYHLVDKIAGTRKASNDKPYIFLNNIKRRMLEVRITKLSDYIHYAKKSPSEYNHLVSALTIHTTYWFREPRHFTHVEKEIENNFKDKKIRVLSLGCSTGEEVYSLALTLDKYRKKYPVFDYEVYGYDIDGISVNTANKCIYKSEGLQKIPVEYRNNILIGSGKTAGMMTLSKDVRSRCHFSVLNALKIQGSDIGKFDIIFCRNMLIYFSTEQVQMIVRGLVEKASLGCLFCVGHSEDVSYYTKDLERITGSTYRRFRLDKRNIQNVSVNKNISTAIVISSDSVTTSQLKLITEISDCSLEEKKYLKNIEQYLCDEDIGVIFLDLEIENDPVEWLLKLRRSGIETPCVLLSKNDNTKSVEALSASAQDIFIKDTLVSQRGKLSEKIISLLKSKKILKRKPREPVLVVDDDDDVREMFCDVLEAQDFTTVSFANPKEALEYLLDNMVHCVVTDYQMPEMTGDIFAKKIKDLRSNIPVVMITGYSDEAQKLEKDGSLFRFLEKPVPTEKIVTVLHDATRAKYTGELTCLNTKELKSKSLIVIGASTGGPNVLKVLLKDIGREDLPPVVVVQHIQRKFQLSFAENIAVSAGLEIGVLEKEMLLEKGKIYFSEPDCHIKIRKRDSQWCGYRDNSPPYKGHRPCVEHLFQSVANIQDKSVLGILLTGMGDDGSKGLCEIHKMGGYTVAQDLKSSVVFGMPRMAIDMGGVSLVGDIPVIRKAILATVKP